MHGQPVVVIGGLYAGSAEEGERALAPLRELGTPLVDLSGRVSYLQAQAGFDEFFPAGLLYYWKSLYLDALGDDVVDAMVEAAANGPQPRPMLVLRHLGGAISQVPDGATAYGNRRAAFNLSLDATWSDPRDSERMIEWTRQAWAALRERTGGGVYLNFPGFGEDNELLARAGYGRSYDRLRDVKRRYDPTNVFRGNVNVAP
jgi:FAD/FMN-containing dehydrogenase